jgi:hypothetical protein
MTTGTIQEARLEIVEILQAADIGLKSVPDQIPAKAQPFPFAVAHFSEGTFEIAAGQLKGLHDYDIEIHVARRNIKYNYDRIEKLAQDTGYWLAKKLNEKKFTKLEHWDYIRLVLGPSEWAEVPTLALFLTLVNTKVYTTL